MSAKYTQDNRPISATTPLGKDRLLLTGVKGTEGISQLFSFQLDFLALNETPVPFDKLLGQKITAEFAAPKRYFNGIVVRISEGERDEIFTSYQIEIVPQFWLLTRRAQSRIFQHLSVPNILKKVLEGLDVDYQLQGSYFDRDYCVQYRETDFAFACRLMEEEGIFYFFKHTDSGHTMVVADTALSHPEVPDGSPLIYENVTGGTRKEERIHDWAKVQELRSGKCTLWDHCFELPHKHLEADKSIQISVDVGTVTHQLKVGGNDKMELYDFPGEYAQRFDGIAPSGGDRGADVQKIFEDNTRTVGIRMQQEAVPALRSEGTSNCHRLVSGYKFTLDRHFNADGEYLLVSVQHTATMNAYRSQQEAFSYTNRFTCIPCALPFRPLRVTPRPSVQGSQSAVVVGPPGEEIFTDKYGRVKVQFHWDRQGKNDADSSCWIRVATHWAGKSWGGIHLPRIGQEVIVDFLEGDPDNPIIVGSVYNADQMPPFALPGNKTQSGIRTRSSPGGNPATCNEFRFEDKMGSELVFLHAEKDSQISVEHNEDHTVGHDRSVKVEHDESEQVLNNRTAVVGNNEDVTIAVNRSTTVGASERRTVGASRTTEVGGSDSHTVGGSLSTTVGGAITTTAGGAISTTAGGIITTTAGGAIAITAGAALTITAGGTVAINAPAILLNGRLVLPIAPVPIV